MKIKTEKDYNDVLSRIDEIMDAEAGPELDELKILTKLVEANEEVHYPISRERKWIPRKPT